MKKTKKAKLADKGMNKNMKRFEEFCRMSQKGLKKRVAKELRNTHQEVLNEDGFVFAKGEFPVLLVAHLDTVHKELPSKIYYDSISDSVFCEEGIGGDDRCGVYMVLEIVKKYNCSVLFCEDEEIGAVGAEKFVKSKVSDGLTFNYAIELDRKGSNDAVFYDCDNPDFERFVTQEFFKTAWGSFSDISTLAPYLGCAAVNLSCGYYNAHTKNEYVVIGEMLKVIEETCKILERTTENDSFEYIEYKYNWRDYKYNGYGNSGFKLGCYGNDDYGYSKNGAYDDYGYDDTYYMFEYADENGKTQYTEIWADTETEAIGEFCMENPTIPFGNVINIYQDKDLYVR